MVQALLLPVFHDIAGVVYKVAYKLVLTKLDSLCHSDIRFATDAPYKTQLSSLYLNRITITTREACGSCVQFIFRNSIYECRTWKYHFINGVCK